MAPMVVKRVHQAVATGPGSTEAVAVAAKAQGSTEAVVMARERAAIAGGQQPAGGGAA